MNAPIPTSAMNFGFSHGMQNNFGYQLSRRSTKGSGSMIANMDYCTALCIAIIVITMAIVYHVHDLAKVEEAKDANSTTFKRLDKIRTALFLLLVLEFACLYAKMM